MLITRLSPKEYITFEQEVFLLLLLEEPVADGSEFIGVVEGAHVFIATAVLVQDGALSEHDEVDVVALGQ